jgi:hypothetical protein
MTIKENIVLMKRIQACSAIPLKREAAPMIDRPKEV